MTDKLSENGKKAALVISAICSLILIYFMLRYGIEMVQNQIRFHSKTTALRWPTYIQGLALPAGAVFMGIRTIQAAYQQLKEGRQK
ncbi:TRAP transporter small permease [Lachnospiraceae bacterium OF09-6]|nr:TRAP transporter small permease [Lachnospiraceae bacterium OF09-6]